MRQQSLFCNPNPQPELGSYRFSNIVTAIVSSNRGATMNRSARFPRNDFITSSQLASLGLADVFLSKSSAPFLLRNHGVYGQFSVNANRIPSPFEAVMRYQKVAVLTWDLARCQIGWSESRKSKKMESLPSARSQNRTPCWHPQRVNSS